MNIISINSEGVIISAGVTTDNYVLGENDYTVNSSDSVVGKHYNVVTGEITDIKTTPKPTVQLTNFVIKASSTTVEHQYGIYRVGINEAISASANIEDTDGVLLSIMETTAKPSIEMDIIVERIKSGDVNNVIDDTRFGVTMTDKEMTLDVNAGFTIGGNYVITQERLNQGLDTLGAPFNIEMPKIEFNALNK